MTAAPSWWLAMQEGGRVEVLGPDECRRLLHAGHVGRLAYVTDDGPRVVPINYSLVGDNLVFRLQPQSEAARSAEASRVAFEVDHVDEFLQSGWSVLAVGVANELTVEMRQSLDVHHTPTPWPQGSRTVYLHLPLTRLTGRRVHPG
jgi:hypothetical protein